MEKDLRNSAEKTVNNKLTFFTTTLVFSAAAIVLIILSFAIPSIAFWVLIPLPVLAMVLGVLYFNAFGYPGVNRNAENWKEEEIEREMRKILRSQKAKQTSNRLPENEDKLTLEPLTKEKIPDVREEDFV